MLAAGGGPSAEAAAANERERARAHARLVIKKLLLVRIIELRSFDIHLSLPARARISVKRGFATIDRHNCGGSQSE